MALLLRWEATLFGHAKECLSLRTVVSVSIIYLGLVRYLRNRRLRKIISRYSHLLDQDGNLKPDAEMNPLDAQEIVGHLGRFEFPFIMNKSTEFALFKTYGIGDISKLLVHTTQLAGPKTAAKRGEDTALMFCEFIENSLDSDRAKIAISRINFMHRIYGSKISNANLMYTWAAVVIEERDWVAKLEWRQLHPIEELASYTFWREVGYRMGISRVEVPPTLKELEVWYREYEEKHLVYSESSNTLAEGLIAVMLSSVGLKALHPFVRKGIIALLDDKLRLAMGLEEASPTVHKTVQRIFAVRAFFIRHFCLPRFWAATPGNSPHYNSQGKLQRYKYNFEPYYVPRTWYYMLQGYLLTGLLPSKEKYHSDGFVVESDIGPENFRGKGVDRVRYDAQMMETANKGKRIGCPVRFN